MLDHLLLRTRRARGALTGLMTLAWTGALSLAAPAPADKLSPLEAKLNRSFAAIEAASRETPRDRFDPDSILEKVGREPNDLFAFVRSQTRYVPYEGRLRGPVGVLMDRLGNSLDRSLLLATLLRSAGFEVRLAKAPISPEQATSLIDLGAPIAGEAAVDQTADIRRVAGKFGLDADAILNNLKGERVEAERLMEDGMARVAQQTPLLAAALDPSGAAESAAPVVTYWWAEAKDGDAWVAYDLSAAAPGKPMAAAAATVALDAVPADLNHSVNIRVSIEQWDGGALHEKKVLERTIAAADVVGTPVQLTHDPLKWPVKLDVADGADPKADILAKLRQQNEWLPVLWVGNQPTAQASFLLDGSTNDKPQTGGADSIAKAAGGAFGGLTGGGEPAAAAGAALTAEWIDYEIQTPGRPTRVVRRQVFDLVGPAARRAGVSQKPGGTDDARRLNVGLRLMGSTDMLVQSSGLASQYFESRLLTDTLKSKDLFLTLARKHGDAAPAGEQAVAYGQLTGSDLPSLALARQQWSKHAGDVYFDRINVLTYHAFLRDNGKGDFAGCESYDIVANDIAVRPGLDARAVRLEQGVLDTAAEALLIGNCGKVHNTSELQAVSKDAWLKIVKPEDAAIGSSGLSADVQARVRQDLADGFVVMLPKAVPDGRQAAWWRIDPKTGTALGIGENGWGQSSTETTLANVRMALNILDYLMCAYSASGIKSNAGWAAALAACAVKSTAKGAKMIISGPAKIGAGLALDLVGDVIGAMVAPGIKIITK